MMEPAIFHLLLTVGMPRGSQLECCNVCFLNQSTTNLKLSDRYFLFLKCKWKMSMFSMWKLKCCEAAKHIRSSVLITYGKTYF